MSAHVVLLPRPRDAPNDVPCENNVWTNLADATQDLLTNELVSGSHDQEPIVHTCSNTASILSIPTTQTAIVPKHR